MLIKVSASEFPRCQ